MWLSSWLRNRALYRLLWERAQRPSSAPHFRPRLEALEERTLLSAYTAANVSELIADVNAANKAGGTNTITLTALTTSPYALTAVNNTTNGANGLPVITSGDNLTILGNGDVIEPSTTAGTAAFRFFDVVSGGALTLQNLTLQNGGSVGTGAADGGAIYNQGTLTLSGVTVQDNYVRGSDGASNVSPSSKASDAVGHDAAGGAIWSSGTLTLQDLTLASGAILHTTLQNNQVDGGKGGTFSGGKGGRVLEGAAGGNALGGAIYIAGGTARLTSVNLSNNAVHGGAGGTVETIGNGGTGGGAFGGALDVAGGTVTLTGVVLQSNAANGLTPSTDWGGAGGSSGSSLSSSQGAGGVGAGGAVNVTAGSVTLTACILENNVAQGGSAGAYDPYGTSDSGVGGNAYGGALTVSGGSVTLNGDTLQSNQAISGWGEPGGNAYGGALAVSGGTVILSSETVQSNQASASTSAYGSDSALGGGIYIASAASAYLDSFTVANTLNNDALWVDSFGYSQDTPSNIYGTYTLENS